MERPKESIPFDPYTYKGSPEVKVINGYAAVVAGFMLFSVINKVITSIGPSQNVKDVWRWRNTYVSWIHADIVGLGVVHCLLFKPYVFEDMVIYCDYFIYFLLSFSLGYFLYDFCDHVINNKVLINYEVILHHIAVIWIFGYNICYRVNVAYTVVALMTEVNSIFLHARKLMQFDKWPFNHLLYRIVIVLNFVTFICFRMYAVIMVGFAINSEWDRMTRIYQICLMAAMGIMYLINPVLLWRLFKSDVLRGYKNVSKVWISSATNGHQNGSLHRQ